MDGSSRSGAGNGINFEHYPESVTEVIAVEPEPYLRRQAERAAADAPVPVRVQAGVAASLELAAGSADVVVVCGVLCSVPDQREALAEARRVLRPGGELRFYEHVRSRRPGFARWQRRIDPLWSRAMGGCHTDRDTLAAIADAGFRLERCRGFGFPAGARLPGGAADSRTRPRRLKLVHASANSDRFGGDSWTETTSNGSVPMLRKPWRVSAGTEITCSASTSRTVSPAVQRPVPASRTNVSA